MDGDDWAQGPPVPRWSTTSTSRRKLGYWTVIVALGTIPGLGVLFLLWAAGNWTCADSGDSSPDCDEESMSFLRLLGVVGLVILAVILLGLLAIVSARKLPWPDPSDPRRVSGPGVLTSASLGLGLFVLSFVLMAPDTIWLAGYFRYGEVGELYLHGGGALALVIAWTVRADLRYWGAERSSIRRANAAVFVAACATFLPAVAVWLVWWWIRRTRGHSSVGGGIRPVVYDGANDDL